MTMLTSLWGINVQDYLFSTTYESCNIVIKNNLKIKLFKKVNN